MRFGSTGPAVELLQLALDRAGFGPLLTDGVFGPATRGALSRFQAVNGLRVDAVAGHATHKALTPWYTGYVTLRIRPGDTVWALARRYGSSTEAVLLANPGLEPENLQIGAALTVPLPFPVVPEGIRFSSDLTAFCVQGLGARYPRFPFPSGWKANIRGVDLNLQYPAGWEEARLNKYGQGITSPAPADFVGEAPLTAPEARAMAELTERFAPALTLSYHSQGEVIFWNWRDYAPENAASIGRLFAELSGYRLLEEPAAPSSAGYKDWYLQEFRRPGYTVEVGRGVNPLPIRDFPAIYAKNLPLLTIAALVT